SKKPGLENRPPFESVLQPSRVNAETKRDHDVAAGPASGPRHRLPETPCADDSHKVPALGPITVVLRIRTRTSSSLQGSDAASSDPTPEPLRLRSEGGRSRTLVASRLEARGRPKERRQADREPRAGTRARSTARFRAPR